MNSTGQELSPCVPSITLVRGRVLEKSGFVLESLRQKAAKKKGAIFNDCVYVLIL